nr:MAG TPA: protein of unknown function (DUF5463) [Bacteriophage sp.]
MKQHSILGCCFLIKIAFTIYYTKICIQSVNKA